jgi:hypothetical protein
MAWAAVALVNLSAMTIFLWHQTALMATTAGALPAGRLPGLHTAPDDLGWVAVRLLWLPVFATALAVCWTAFRGCERVGARRYGRVAARRCEGAGVHAHGQAGVRRYDEAGVRSGSLVVRVHDPVDHRTSQEARHV